MSADGPEELQYYMRPLFGQDGGKLECELHFKGNPTGITKIIIPSGGEDLKEAFIDISHLESLTGSKVEDTDQKEHKYIYHKPNELIKIRYLVNSGKWLEKNGYHCPIIDRSYFHCFGDHLFVCPQMDEHQEVQVGLKWENFPKGWCLANSHGMQQTQQEIVTTLAFLRNSIYVGGDFKIIQCEDDPFVFAATRGSFIPSIHSFSKVAGKIINTQSSFWQDSRTTPFLITILPLDLQSDNMGRALFNSFTLCLSEKMLGPNIENCKWLIHMFSHEYFHHWNGEKIRFSTPDYFGWFTEGFTDYYALLLTLKPNLINEKECTESLNTTLQAYHSSPFRNAPNEQIVKEYLTCFELDRLRYQRGALFAAYWDNKISSLTHGKHSLDDLMYGLLDKIKKKNSFLTMEDLIQQASLYLGNEAKEDIEKFIVQGETLTVTLEGADALKWPPVRFIK